MPFAIRFVPPEEVDWESEPEEVRYGQIQLGNFSEHFQVDLEFWRQEDYEIHWRQALVRITTGSEVSCLLTSIGDPQCSTMVFWWPLYRTGDTIRVQNAIRFFEHLDAPFDPGNPFASVPERQEISEDGERISEWTISVQDVQDFLRESS